MLVPLSLLSSIMSQFDAAIDGGGCVWKTVPREQTGPHREQEGEVDVVFQKTPGDHPVEKVVTQEDPGSQRKLPGQIDEEGPLFRSDSSHHLPLVPMDGWGGWTVCICGWTWDLQWELITAAGKSQPQRFWRVPDCSLMSIRLMAFGNMGGCGPGQTAYGLPWPPWSPHSPWLFLSKVDFQVQTWVEPRWGILTTGGTEARDQRLIWTDSHPWVDILGGCRGKMEEGTQAGLGCGRILWPEL